jgi:hypothetical protein
MVSSESLATSHSVARFSSLGLVWLVLLMLPAWAETPKSPIEPRVFSVCPLGGRPGSAYQAAIRGVTLRDASAVWFESDGMHARIDQTDSDHESDPKASTSVHLKQLF